MSAKPKIIVIHPNSLCCMAMRTILVDIAPFVGMFRDVEILSYNSLEQMLQDQPQTSYSPASSVPIPPASIFAVSGSFSCRQCVSVR